MSFRVLGEESVEDILADVLERLRRLEYGIAAFVDPATTADHGNLEGLADNDHPQYILESLADAVGDMLVAYGNDDIRRLPAGANGEVLTVDTTDPAGVAWQAPGGGSGHTIEENGTPLAARTGLNFVEGLVATDDAGNDETDINADWATTEIADVAAAESAGVGTKVPRADHVHAHGSGYLPNAHHNQSHGVADHSGAVNVEEGNVLAGPASTIDFGAGFDVTVAADEADITLDASEVSDAPVQIDIGDAQTTGAATTFANSAHQHAFPAPGAGYPLDVAAAESDGVATTPARSDHVHAHGSGYLPNAHHNQAHGVADHTTAVTVEDEGVSQGDALTLNFTGAGVTASVAAGEATINIPGGGGSGDTLLAWVGL